MRRLPVAVVLLFLHGCSKHEECDDTKDEVGVELVVVAVVNGERMVLMRTSAASKRNAVGTMWKTCPKVAKKDDDEQTVQKRMQNEEKGCYMAPWTKPEGKLCAAAGGIKEQLRFAWKRAGLSPSVFEDVAAAHGDFPESGATKFRYKRRIDGAESKYRQVEMDLRVFRAEVTLGNAQLDAGKDPTKDVDDACRPLGQGVELALLPGVQAQEVFQAGTPAHPQLLLTHACVRPGDQLAYAGSGLEGLSKGHLYRVKDVMPVTAPTSPNATARIVRLQAAGMWDLNVPLRQELTTANVLFTKAYQWLPCHEISTRASSGAEPSLNHDAMIMAVGACPEGSVVVNTSLVALDVPHRARVADTQPYRRGFREAEVQPGGVTPELKDIRKA